MLLPERQCQAFLVPLCVSRTFRHGIYLWVFKKVQTTASGWRCAGSPAFVHPVCQELLQVFLRATSFLVADTMQQSCLLCCAVGGLVKQANMFLGVKYRWCLEMVLLNRTKEKPNTSKCQRVCV